MSISERQNNEINLKRLAAQRQLYSEAKKITNYQYVTTGVITTILVVVGNLLPDKYVVYPILISLIITVLNEVFLRRLIDEKKTTATRIQEIFDCDVLQIKANLIKYDNMSFSEIVHEKSKKYFLKEMENETLRDWYPGMESVEHKYGKLVCQGTNCWWDQSLRRKFNNFILVATSVLFVILLLIAVTKGITINSFIMSVVSPILPCLFIVYQISCENKKTIRALNQMKIKLEDIVNKIRIKQHKDSEFDADIRSLQDLIYDKRVSSPLIPDVFYSIYRSKFEEIAKATNVEITNTVNEVIKN